MLRQALKKVVWVGSSRSDIKQLGEDLCDAFGTDLLSIQYGLDPISVKHLHNGMSEIKLTDSDGAYRLFYVAKFEEAIYVLHVFNKKSNKDGETPKRDASIIASRFSEAARLHALHAKERE
jgi:phage-related protein